MVLCVATVALALAPAASAHVTRQIGPYEVTLGWGNEPPLAGLDNFVEVGVTGAGGAPVNDLGPSPEVQVSFGGAETVVPLVPSEEPGAFRGALVPTRPGTYSFRFSASIAGRAVSTGATCSERTFECVIPVSEVEFPVKDPALGEIAQRIVSDQSRIDQASDDADSARTIALVALALAAMALAAALVVVIRGRRQG
ncbi:MAG: hypothetical protein QOI10_1625 [Solirubrobacterales bacterium]|nr:hypothetical protein [Solirubrobacterales bacterium]